MSGMSGKDTKTRYQGVFARHQKDCSISRGARCNCKPSYYGVVWDRARKRHVKTKRMPTIDAAQRTLGFIRTCRTRRAPGGRRHPHCQMRASRFVAAAREGRVLNKHGRRYKPRAVDDIEEVLRVHVEPTLGTTRISTSDEAMFRRSSTSFTRVVRQPGSIDRERVALAV